MDAAVNILRRDTRPGWIVTRHFKIKGERAVWSWEEDFYPNELPPGALGGRSAELSKVGEAASWSPAPRHNRTEPAARCLDRGPALVELAALLGYGLAPVVSWLW